MAKKATGAKERLDELYREHPDGFVAGRNELAKEVRAAGDRAEADRIKKLRRPSVAAWLINRTAHSSSEPLEEFADATRRLEEAEGRALEGDDEAVAEWRARRGRAAGGECRRRRDRHRPRARLRPLDQYPS